MNLRDSQSVDGATATNDVTAILVYFLLVGFEITFDGGDLK